MMVSRDGVHKLKRLPVDLSRDARINSRSYQACANAVSFTLPFVPGAPNVMEYGIVIHWLASSSAPQYSAI